MKRSMCGLVVLAAATTTLWSCNGDPIDPSGERIVTDPASVFVDHGESQFVEARMFDNQGNQLPVDFTAENVGPGITVEKDTTFLQTTIGTTLETRQRFTVTGVTPAATQFDLVSGGQRITIPVRVLPTGFTVTFSNPAPVQNEIVTVTASEGFKFSPTAEVIFGADTAVVVGRGADSNSISFVPEPREVADNSVATIAGVLATGVAPTAPLTISTADSLTLPVWVTVPGTESPTTAPALPIPAPGQTTAFFDLPDFVATIDHFYRLDIAEAGDYTVTVDWNVGSDLDAPVCVSDPTCASEDFADPTVSANHPETGGFTLPAGTHTLLVEDYGGDAAGPPPSLIKITISR